MAMTVNDFSTGPQGANVTTAIEGFSLQTLNGGTMTYDTAGAYGGTGFGVKVANVPGQACVARLALDNPGDQLAFAYAFRPLQTTLTANATILQPRSVSAPALLFVQTAANKLSMYDAASTAAAEVQLLTTAMTLTNIYRLEGTLNRATGAYTVSVFLGTSTTAINTVSGTGYAMGAAAFSHLQVGVTTAPSTANTMWFDYVVRDAGGTTLPGPAASSAALAASLAVSPTTAAGVHTVTATANATGGTGTTKLYTFRWPDGTTTAAQTANTASWTTSAVVGSYTVYVDVVNT